MAIGIAADVTDEAAVQAAIDATVLAFGGIDIVVNNAGLSLSKSLLDTTAADWDLQHNVMARGSFLVSKAAAKALIDQKLGGDIIYISSKNSVFAGPNNIAYSATKADQAHQVRLLAAELGEHGIKVNGINPDGVVRGSGIFAGGWGAKRAAVYGVAEEDLGKYYAQRTLLKREVLPENIANAAFALCTSDFSHTTGPARPGRRGRRRGLLAMSTCARAGTRSARRRPRRHQRAGHARRRRTPTLDMRAVARIRQRSGGAVERHPARPALGCCPACSGTSATGLTAAAQQADDLVGIGVDSWAVDYGLLRDGRLLAQPHHYRDERIGDRASTSCTPRSIAADLYRRNGLQFLPFQHGVPTRGREGRRAARAWPTRLLLVPDLINYWLTGRTGRGTHQRVHHGAAGRRRRLGPRADAPAWICPERCSPTSSNRAARWDRCCPSGRARGSAIASRWSSVASHDTASAVAAIPDAAGSSRLHLLRHLGIGGSRADRRR